MAGPASSKKRQRSCPILDLLTDDLIVEVLRFFIDNRSDQEAQVDADCLASCMLVSRSFCAAANTPMLWQVACPTLNLYNARHGRRSLIGFRKVQSQQKSNATTTNVSGKNYLVMERATGKRYQLVIDPDPFVPSLLKELLAADFLGNHPTLPNSLALHADHAFRLYPNETLFPVAWPSTDQGLDALLPFQPGVTAEEHLRHLMRLEQPRQVSQLLQLPDHTWALLVDWMTKAAAIFELAPITVARAVEYVILADPAPPATQLVCGCCLLLATRLGPIEWSLADLVFCLDNRYSAETCWQAFHHHALASATNLARPVVQDFLVAFARLTQQPVTHRMHQLAQRMLACKGMLTEPVSRLAAIVWVASQSLLTHHVWTPDLVAATHYSVSDMDHWLDQWPALLE